MKLFSFAIFDSAAGVYDRPFFAQSDGQAMRAFGDMCVSAEHPFGQHPADYTLFRVGVYNDADASLVGESPERLCNGVEMVAKSRKIVNGNGIEVEELE